MKLKGSLVIEAAIIFPTVIIAMFAIIFFAYYEHDIVGLSGIQRKIQRESGLSLRKAGKPCFI